MEHWRIATDPHRTADEIAVVLHGLLAQHTADRRASVDGIALCSTVPSVLHEMRDVCQRYYGDVPAVVVEPGVRTGVPVLTDNPKEVGTDRVVNALAAVELYGGPCIVVDLRHGDDVRRGVGHGGVPRWRDRTRHRDLGGRAGRPGSPAAPGRAGPPALGDRRNTVEALQAGILFGFAGQVEGVVTRMSAEIGAGDPDDVTVVATGGLAPMVLDECRCFTDSAPWLTLRGLELVFQRNS